MARRSKKQQQSNRFSLLDCDVRPVTKADKWCRHRMPEGDVGNAPFGYVVTIPYCPNKNTVLDNVDGYIVRTKKYKGNLLLQVIKKDFAPEYGVKSTSRRRKKQNERIMSIKNLHKSEGKWGKEAN